MSAFLTSIHPSIHPFFLPLLGSCLAAVGGCVCGGGDCTLLLVVMTILICCPHIFLLQMTFLQAFNIVQLFKYIHINDYNQKKKKIKRINPFPSLLCLALCVHTHTEQTTHTHALTHPHTVRRQKQVRSSWKQ